MPVEIDADSLLLVGRVWRPHGVRGEVKVIPETDDPERFSDLPVIFAGMTPDTSERIMVESVRYQPTKKGTLVVLKLDGIDTREEADELRKALIFASTEDLPSLEEDEFFLHDLVGLAVETEDGSRVGTIDDVMGLPAHDVIIVGRSDAPPAMIPAVPEFVIAIDLDAAKVIIRPIEGLLE